MSLNAEIIEILACPRCKSKLDAFECKNCSLHFPLVDDIPILLNESHSLFKISDLIDHRETTYKNSSPLKRTFRQIIPSISLNVKAKENLSAFFSELTAETQNPRVLVIGGAVAGVGFDILPPEITLIETDVAIGPRTTLVCDAHDLPFQDETIDGVIAQAVMEHVLDPAICVSEIHRVLKKGGVVWADTPFIQQVHAGRYDFLRFTHLGHRYLFRHFSEIASGPSCGPGMALAWAYCYFLQSFFSNKMMGKAAFAFGSLTGFWLKYLDYFLINRPNAYDAASAYFFLGRKAETKISGSELIKGYKGLIS
ncbi:MAG: methyltransferase domain-containing protein [Pyrinomonadaceae bacterium]